MLTATFQDDLVTGLSSGIGLGGLPVPPGLAGQPPRRMRVSGGAVIDAAGVTRWAIDEAGRKRLPEAADPAWPLLDCAWDDEIVGDGAGGWRVATAADGLAALARTEHRAALAAAQAQVARIEGRYTSAERLSWGRQAAQAQVVADGGTIDPLSLVARRAARKGRSVADEAARVLLMAEAFENVMLLAADAREAAEALLAAPDAAALDAARTGVADALAALTAAVDPAAGA